MLENITLSFQGIWSHKLRSLLTMLGIIIGIASIIVIVSTIKGTNEQIKENLIGAGNNVVSVTLKQDKSEYDMQYNGLPKGVSVIKENTRRSLENLEGVKEVSLYRMRTYADSVYYKNTAFNGNLIGIDNHYFSVQDYTVAYGRSFTDFDNRTYHKCAIVDSGTAASIFEGENPIGKIIEIKTEPFVVIGVAEKRNQTELKINTVDEYWTYADTAAGSIFIPIETWQVIYRFDEPQNVSVRAESTDLMTKAGNNVAKALTSRQVQDVGGKASKFSYTADDLLKEAARMQSLANSTNTQLIWIAGISLLVGGIGVMNIMLVSVTERTREIGLKKAIGAKRNRIAVQFLTEAAVLTSLGGLIGVVSGIILSRVVSNVMETPSSVSIPACIVSVVFSMAIGIVFGLLPAVKASKLNPIDALRSE
ncbi:MAG: ABC transporter permease [Lachnospiraceae bacterium]|nr:ABC transporter permease [Lachnospiraceae bacterium]